MTAPITPDERAEWRALADAAFPGPWMVIEDHVRVHGVGTNPGEKEASVFEDRHVGTADARFIAAARTAVPRLLDALDTAEASLRSRSDLIARLQQGKRFADGDVKRLRRERDEARSAAVIAAPARPAPAWDEDTVTEAVARTLWEHTPDLDETAVFTGECDCGWRTPGPAWEATEEEHRPHVAAAVLTVVREHLPVRPDRETIARAIDPRPWDPACTPIGWSLPTIEAARVRALVRADAVLDLWPGESRATVQAEALRDAADAAVAQDNNQGDWWDDDRQTYGTPVDWLRARADRLEKGADRG